MGPLKIARFRERALRFPTKLNVEVATFGTAEVYRLDAINASYTGLLLASLQLLPYQVRTIVELTVELEHNGKREFLHLVGKISRLAKGKTAGIQKYADMFELAEKYTSIFGIAIVDMSDSDLQIWKEYVDYLEMLNNNQATATTSQVQKSAS